MLEGSKIDYGIGGVGACREHVSGPVLGAGVWTGRRTRRSNNVCDARTICAHMVPASSIARATLTDMAIVYQPAKQTRALARCRMHTWGFGGAG